MDLILEAWKSLQGDTLQYSQGVLIWMRMMAVSFLASLIFVYSKPPARWILLALVLNVTGLICGKLLYPDANRALIGTYVHLIFWPGILIAIWRRPPILAWPKATVFDRIFIIWISWASLILSVSILLDIRSFVSFI